MFDFVAQLLEALALGRAIEKVHGPSVDTLQFQSGLLREQRGFLDIANLHADNRATIVGLRLTFGLGGMWWQPDKRQRERPANAEEEFDAWRAPRFECWEELRLRLSSSMTIESDHGSAEFERSQSSQCKRLGAINAINFSVGLVRGPRRKSTDEKKPRSISARGFSLITSLTITYFHTGCSTIIGAKSFHGPVRDGKGWDRLAMVIRHNLYRRCSQRGSTALNLEEVSFIIG